jgi:hypothetical protein
LENEPRKASDVLLELEKKLDVVLGIIRNQDLTIKILSNKLNSLLDNSNKQLNSSQQKIVVEAVNTSNTPQQMHVSQFQQLPELNPEKQIPVSSESTLPLETEPKGFRRTSRPETFSGDNAYLSQAPKFPVQLPQNKNQMQPPPGRAVAEIVVQPKKEQQISQQKNQQENTSTLQNTIPVMQRVVNSHGKSLFLADVEILDLSNMQQVFKTRTNGTGKWMASLGLGNYRVIIRKLDSATKERLEVPQDIQVDGSHSPYELPAIIIKSG